MCLDLGRWEGGGDLRVGRRALFEDRLTISWKEAMMLGVASNEIPMYMYELTLATCHGRHENLVRHTRCFSIALPTTIRRDFAIAAMSSTRLPSDD